jgi:hypothetical protein
VFFVESAPSVALPAPVFWGVLAAWIPVPPSIMAGALCAAMIYALCSHLLGLRDWVTDDESGLLPDEPITSRASACLIA